MNASVKLKGKGTAEVTAFARAAGHRDPKISNPDFLAERLLNFRNKVFLLPCLRHLFLSYYDYKVPGMYLFGIDPEDVGPFLREHGLTILSHIGPQELSKQVPAKTLCNFLGIVHAGRNGTSPTRETAAVADNPLSISLEGKK